MKQNVSALPQLEEESSFTVDNITVPVQPVVVKATRDYTKDVNPRNPESNWRGYIVEFTESKVVKPISAGLLLKVSNEQGVTAFEEGEEGHVLINHEFGLIDGQPTFTRTE